MSILGTLSAVNRQLVVSNISKFKHTLCNKNNFLSPKFALNVSDIISFSTSNGGQRAVLQQKTDDPSLWVSSPVTDLKPCAGLTVPELIRERAKDWESKIAYECIDTQVKYTHAQVFEKSRGFAASLLKSNVGFKRGNVVAVMSHNIPEFASILFGIWETGLVPTVVNTAYSLYEIKSQLQSSGAKAIVTVPHYLPAVRTAISEMECDSYFPIIIVGEPHKGCLTFHDMTKTNPSGLDFPKGSQMDTQNDTALLLYTSGTTGTPKGIVLTHSNLTNNLLQVNHPSLTAVEPGSKLIGAVPFFHSYGLTSLMLTTMYQGAHTMTIPIRVKPAIIIRGLVRHKPTTFHLDDDLISFLIKHEDISKDELSSINCFVSARAHIAPPLVQKLLEKAGKFVEFRENYGMTELTSVSHMLPSSEAKNKKYGSCGVPVPLTVTKIVDNATGETLARGEKGEICVKGPQVMKSYLNYKIGTQKAIDSQGWLHTGDMGYYDKENCFHITGRI